VHADDSVVKLKAVLAEAHGAFGTQMLDTVRDFQEHLEKASSEPMTEEAQRATQSSTR
jgi:hypothetical protein